MTTTHRGLDNPNGMPNAELLDYQVRQVTAYLLSLRKILKAFGHAVPDFILEWRLICINAFSDLGDLIR